MSGTVAQMVAKINKLERDLSRSTSGQYSTHEWIYANDARWVGTQYAPLTSTSWDGDSFSTVSASTQLDLSAIFGVPAGVKAIIATIIVRDSGSATYDARFLLFPDSSSGAAMAEVDVGGRANDYLHRAQRTIACDANGDIYYQVVASGTGTMDVWIRIWGYYL